MKNIGLSSFVSDHDVNALKRPAGEALGLPGRAYGAGFFELEQRRLFPRTWCASGFASDVPEPGDALPVDLAGWPLVLVRGGDGEVRAFHNVCRHRSNRVVDAPCRGLKRLTCPWHGWSYDLAGKLLGTPRIGGEKAHEDASFDTAVLGLKAVPTAVWLDFVMVNIDGNAARFEDHIRPLRKLLSDYDYDDIRVGAGWSMMFEGSWKLTVEGALEDYHIPCIHPELMEGSTQDRPRLDHAPGCYFANSANRDSASVHGKVRREAGVEGPPLLREGAEPRTFAINVFPTGFITARVDMLLLQVMLPHGARRTRIASREYYKGDAATDPALAGLREAVSALWQKVFEQDQPLVGNVQHNMDRPGQRGIRTRFSPFWESNVQRFQQSVINCLQASE